MRFTCESCKALLQIADDRVRGKRVAVRCTKCGTRMEIADPALPRRPAAGAVNAAASPNPAQQGAGDEDTRAMDSDLLERAVRASKDDEMAATFAVEPVPQEMAAWFAMLGGKQVGPMTFEEIGAQVESGAVGPRTYLWREGMDAWAHAKDVAEVAPFFAPAPKAEPGAAARATAGAPSAPAPPPAGAAAVDLARWASAELDRGEKQDPAAAPAPERFAPRPQSGARLWVWAAVVAVVVAAAVAAALLFSGTARSDPLPRPAASGAR
jgi:predicted Zn finger-like uncharacterized protein